MNLKAWDYVALLLGSLVVWTATTRGMERILDDHDRRELAGERRQLVTPEPPVRATNEEAASPSGAISSSTPEISEIDPEARQRELSKLAAEILCASSDPAARRVCGRVFLMAAKAQEFTEDEIASHLIEHMVERDPGLVLYLLGMIQTPKSLLISQDKILKDVVRKDLLAAMRMILEFPPGNRFSSALGTLARNLPKDAELPGRVAELLAMLPERREREMLVRDISSSLGDGLMSGRITGDYLRTLLLDKQTDTEMRYGIASVLWYDEAEKPSLEKARKIMEASGGQTGMAAWPMTEELMRRGVPFKDLLSLARSADEPTLQRMLSPMLQSKRMTFEELRDAAMLAVEKAGPGNLNLLNDVAMESARLDPAMDAAMAASIPPEKRDAYRWAMINRDIHRNDFARAMANAESIEDPKGREGAIQTVNMRRRGFEGK